MKKIEMIKQIVEYRVKNNIYMDADFVDFFTYEFH